MRLTALTLVVGVLVIALIFELLRRRQLREKYAVLWLVVAVAILPLAAFPQAFDSIAGLVGVASGVSLALFLGIVLVLVISLHLTWETSRLEEETRTLAEEVALMRMRLDAVERRAADQGVVLSADAVATRMPAPTTGHRSIPAGTTGERVAANRGASRVEC